MPIEKRTVWQRLAAWFGRAKRRGLVDLKIYPGSRRHGPRRRAAEQIVRRRRARIDITKEKL